MRVFSEEGFFVSRNSKHYFFKRYIPEYLELDGYKYQVKKKIKYAESEIGDLTETSFKSQKSYTPPQVSLLCNDADILIKSSSLVLLLEGEKYKPNVLYEFDNVNNEITSFLKLKNEPMEFTLNNQYIISLAISIKGGKNIISIYERK